jgi:hypothetical protein
MDVGTWIALVLSVVSTIATTIGAFYALKTYNQAVASSTRRNAKPISLKFPLWVIISIWLAPLTAWGAVLFGYFHQQPQTRTSLALSWGIEGPPLAYVLVADGSRLMPYAKTHKLMLLVRSVYATVDRLADKNIETSQHYTISNSPVSVGFISKGQINFPNPRALLEYNLILIPNEVAPEQVTSLAEAERLGGRILESPTQDVPASRLQRR